ncbi:MAG TPA: thiolase family protein, partial [Acidimicrobiia bacterium]|nr:thiolase family protein [Acidimicrobiia bacterium]
MTGVRVIGAAMTRFGPSTGGVRSLAEEAVAAAVADAGAAAADVGMVVFGNAAGGVLSGQEMIRGQVALRHTGLLGAPIINVENACASSSSAFHVAWMAVRSGTADVALAVGAEKLTHPDKARTFAMFGTAVDLEEDGEMRVLVESALLGLGSATPGAAARSPLMDLYAATARAYMGSCGATPADFARVAVKNRSHAAGNPHAQFRSAITVDEVLAGRVIADPLRLLMCAPVGDGAAAVVLASE